jgi:tetratricopeptide (TPR) repeat protein
MSGPSFGRTLLLALLAIVGLFLVDTPLARMEQSESRADAERAYKAGMELVRQGKNDQAIEQFRTAIVNVRNDEQYQLALGRAQAAAGHLTDAEQTLSDLLEHNGQDGPANLAMARVLVKEKAYSDARDYYHRAIYGQWKTDPAGNELLARFELVDLIASQKGREGLLAELLPLEEEAPRDEATRMKLGHLFAAAGTPARAAAVFQDVLAKDAHSADAWDALGDTEFTRANYRAALTDFENAARYRTDDQHARDRIGVCREILELDPTMRGLSTEERMRRSSKLLGLTTDALHSCVPLDLAEEADKAEKKRSTDFEAKLDLTGKLWQARQNGCGTVPEAVTLTLNRLSQ